MVGTTLDDPVEAEYLPLHNVMSIVRAVVPRTVRFSKQFQILISKCIAEFIHLIAVKVRTDLRQKKTITDEDLLHCMESLGINQYSTYLRVFLSDYREMVFNILSEREAGRLLAIADASSCALTDTTTHVSHDVSRLGG